MTRREAREQAFILVFEQAIRGEPMDAILHDAAEARDLVPSAFAEQEALGVEAHREEIDSVIEQHIRGWSLRRLSKVALALLRLRDEVGGFHPHQRVHQRGRGVGQDLRRQGRRPLHQRRAGLRGQDAARQPGKDPWVSAF